MKQLVTRRFLKEEVFTINNVQISSYAELMDKLSAILRFFF